MVEPVMQGDVAGCQGSFSTNLQLRNTSTLTYLLALFLYIDLCLPSAYNILPPTSSNLAI